MTQQDPTTASPNKELAILQAATSLFFHFGYRRTSMDDLARRAGVAKGTLYLYFKSKKDVFLAVLQQLHDRILTQARAAAEQDTDFPDKLCALLEARIGLLFELSRGSEHVIDLLEVCHKFGPDITTGLDRTFLQLLAQTLQQAHDTGQIDLDSLQMTPDQAARTVLCTAYGAKHSTDTPSPDQAPPSMDEFRARLRNIVHLVCNGLCRGSSGPTTTTTSGGSG